MRLKIVDKVINDSHKSIKDIKHEFQNCLSWALSIGSIYNTLKLMTFHILGLSLIQKLMIRLEAGDLIGAREAKVENSLTSFLWMSKNETETTRRKEMD